MPLYSDSNVQITSIENIISTFLSINFEKECTKTEMRVKRVGEKKMSVVAIICEHYKGT